MDDNGSSNLTNVRKALQEAVFSDKGWGEDEAGEEARDRAQGAVVTRWVSVIEVMQVDGSRSLVRMSGDASDARLTSWDSDGLHNASLDSNWTDA